jgi:hypothetical protein
MPRKMVIIIVFILLIVAGMFILASLDTEQPLTPVEQPVIGGDLTE